MKNKTNKTVSATEVKRSKASDKCAFCGKQIKGTPYNIGGDGACEECFDYWERHSLAGKAHAKINKTTSATDETIKDFMFRLATKTSSRDDDDKRMETVLRYILGFENARVVLGTVYLDGHGTPPINIHTLAQQIKKARW